jgi:hypothetical protein
MRAQVLKQKGLTIAAKPIGADGTTDIEATLYLKRSITVLVEGSGMPARTLRLRWRR